MADSKLCFSKEKFLVEDFSVDKFVGECRKHASLETMRQDLGMYHRFLCTAMVELINNDYADFVNLSSNLVGLDKSIKGLTSPLENLETNVKSIKEAVSETLNTIQSVFTERSNIHQKRVMTYRIICILEGLEKVEQLNFSSIPYSSSFDSEKLSPDFLERIALEYNFINFHMTKLSSMNVQGSNKEAVDKLNNMLLEHLRTSFSQSLSNEDVQNVQKILRIFSAINKEREAENSFREMVVEPFMRQNLTEEAIIRQGLQKVYENILNFISTSCNTVLKVTRGMKRKSEVVKGYDFLVNAVWPEIVFRFDYISPVYVFAPGDPQLFHKNYSCSMTFIENFERICEVQASVKRLRKHHSYKAFMDKWNLDVYFQIRFQEIAGTFESSLRQPFSKPNGSKLCYFLMATCSLLHCINLCWKDDVFLFTLSHLFWRITLKLISRYRSWAYNYVKSGDKHVSLLNISMLIKDAEVLGLELKRIFSDCIYPKLSSKVSTSFGEAFDTSVESLKDIPLAASQLIIKLQINECCLHLKLITDIPRFYRKTNRDVPSKPSGYSSSVFSPLMKFNSESKEVLPQKWRLFCLKEVTEGVMKQGVLLARDVLTSIKKMEDSLKILKRARDKPMAHSSDGAITDDDKIRRQLVIDVENFEQLIKDMGLKVEDIQTYKELRDLVITAEKFSGSVKQNDETK